MSQTIEQELFSWDGWDGDSECMVFHNPILKVQIGKYPPGSTFDGAFIAQTDDKGCVLQFYNLDRVNPEFNELTKLTYYPMILKGEYKLHYRVGDTISEAQ